LRHDDRQELKNEIIAHLDGLSDEDLVRLRALLADRTASGGPTVD